jgi:hypothetical protein
MMKSVVVGLSEKLILLLGVELVEVVILVLVLFFVTLVRFASSIWWVWFWVWLFCLFLFRIRFQIAVFSSSFAFFLFPFFSFNSLSDETGWAQHLSQPLAEEGIDMLYLSTYHTDIFLVGEQHQTRALQLLKRKNGGGGGGGDSAGGSSVNSDSSSNATLRPPTTTTNTVSTTNTTSSNSNANSNNKPSSQPTLNVSGGSVAVSASGVVGGKLNVSSSSHAHHSSKGGKMQSLKLSDISVDMPIRKGTLLYWDCCVCLPGFCCFLF